MSLMTLQTNLPAITAGRNLTSNQISLESSLRHLSSGHRITNAADDAAGLAVSESLRAQIRGLQQAIRNANDGLSVVNTGEGALTEVSSILVRFRELAVQSASDGLADEERAYLQEEFTALRSEIDRIAATTEFNGTKLLNGSLSATGIEFQIGIRTAMEDRVQLQIGNMSADNFGITSGVGVRTKLEAQACMSTIDAAMTSLNRARANLGAFANRLQSTISSLSITQENLTAANSRIRDTNVAEESAAMARNQVLVQSGVAMLAQANSQPMILTQLLGG